MVANHVSHAHNKTKKRQFPNLQVKRIFVEELGRFIRIRISRHSLRTVDKMGLTAYMKKRNLKLKDLH